MSSAADPRSPVLYVAVAGAWLASLQVLSFSALQMLVSSAHLTYTTVLVGWLSGAALGVWIRPRRWTRLLPVASALASYELLALLAVRPFDTSLLPVHAALVCVTALFAGHLLRACEDRFSSVGRLLFWENNGFLAGLLLSTLLVVVAGRSALVLLPAAGCAAMLLLDPAGRRPITGTTIARRPPDRIPTTAERPAAGTAERPAAGTAERLAAAR